MGDLNPFGGSSASSSGSLDQTLSDASLGEQMMGGTGDFGTGAGANAFTSSDTLGNIVNALSGSPQATQAVAMNPPGAAAATGGDPTGAASGTQSSTSPGQTPPQQQNQQEQQTAPKGSDEQGRAAAIPKLQDLIAALKGKPPGPTFILPEPPKPGDTGPQSPVQSTTPIAQIVNQLMGARKAEARLPPAPVPAPAPDQGGDITVKPRAAAAPRQDPEVGGEEAAPAPAPPAAAPAPAPGPPTQSGPQPAPAATPQQANPAQMSRLMRDITGISQGNPMALADLAMALYGIGAPLAIALGSRGGRPSMRPGGHPGVDYAGGYGEAQSLLNEEDKRQGTLAGLRFNKNGQPAPAGAFNHQGAFVAQPEKTPTSGQIPGVTAPIMDSYVRQAAQKRGMDPNIASKMLGAESGYGQNNLGDYVNGQPTSFGPFQLHFAPDGKAMGDQFFHDTKLDPRNFAQNWKQQVDYALDRATKEGWTPGWTTSMKKLGLNQWSGIQRHFAGDKPKPIPILSHPPLKAGGGFTSPIDPT